MIPTLSKIQLLARFSFTYPCPRKLREIVKMSLLEKETPSRISDIWKEYHSVKSENIAETLSLAEHNTLKTQAGKAPMFLLPVKRQGGHFKLLSQWQNNSVVVLGPPSSSPSWRTSRRRAPPPRRTTWSRCSRSWR